MTETTAAPVSIDRPESQILARWRSMSRLPAGRWLFSRAVGRYVRYSGSVRCRVESLEPGRSVLTMRDRPAVRNHLRSIHACAQVTFGELASGLAMLAATPPGMRAIVTGLEIDYVKKARGTLTATGTAPAPLEGESSEYFVTSELKDEQGDVVSTMRVRWLVGPNEKSRGGAR